MQLDLNGQAIFLTGGTGSFGRAFVRRLLRRFPGIARLVIFSRDEHKQREMAQQLADPSYACLRYVLGDVRDADRLRRASQGADVLIHAAALKQVPAGEVNPMEFVKTNVLGAENVIHAALDNGIRQVVALSTDKAAAPANLYGATKLCAEKLFVAAQMNQPTPRVTFSTVRYGNVLGSRGSVVPQFLRQSRRGSLSLTDPRMTRFSITPDQEVALILHALAHAQGGEIFVPKLPSYRLPDLATAIDPRASQTTIGLRPGEKLHETMITEADAPRTLELADYYLICPGPVTHADNIFGEAFRAKFRARPVPEGFCYDSATNPHWLSVADLAEQVAALADEMAVENEG